MIISTASFPSTQSIFFFPPEQVSAAVIPLSVSWTEERELNIKHTVSSKQMAGRRREVRLGRSKEFPPTFRGGSTDSFCPLILWSPVLLHRPSARPRCSIAPSTQSSRWSCQKVLESTEAAVPAQPQLQMNREHLASSGLVVMDREVQWCPRRSSVCIPSPPPPQLTPAEAQRRGRQRTSRERLCKTVASDGGAGRTRVEWQQPLIGRRRENQPGSVTEKNWRWAERVLSTRGRCWTWGISGPVFPYLETTPSSTPCALTTLFTCWTLSTWQRSVVSDVGKSPLPPGRPFRRDFGNFYSFRPNYLHLFPAKLIFLGFFKIYYYLLLLVVVLWFTNPHRLRIFLGDFFDCWNKVRKITSLYIFTNGGEMPTIIQKFKSKLRLFS